MRSVGTVTVYVSAISLSTPLDPLHEVAYEGLLLRNLSLMPTSSSSCSYSVPSAHENSVCCVSALPAGGNALSATTILILAGQLHGGSANSITAEDDETDALDRTATLPITTLHRRQQRRRISSATVQR